MEETERRRLRQIAFNIEHGIEARSVIKAVKELIDGVVVTTPVDKGGELLPEVDLADERSVARAIKHLEKKMLDHARNLEFEQAAAARDALNELKKRVLQSGA